LVHSSERRKQERLEISGAVTYFRDAEHPGLKNQNYAPAKLVDLSKGGIGFETNEPVIPDEILWVRIKIPEEQMLTLKGTVRWTAPVPGNDRNRVGLRFTLFGREKDYNSPYALEALERIQDKFSSTDLSQ
jgi:hypothetical protein